MASKTALRHDDYTVGWTCISPLETATAKLMLDKVHPPLPQLEIDPNTYVLGSIGKHNVVIATLPFDIHDSLTPAPLRLVSTFPAIRCIFSVGIGGGIPSSDADIRLGDIVVSHPTDRSPGGVIQYDLGRVPGEIATLDRPPEFLLAALATLRAHHSQEDSQVAEFVPDIGTDEFQRPASEDCLFQAGYVHIRPDDRVLSDTCINCDRSELVLRPKRDNEGPVVHYGLIVSTNQVLKDSKTRDRLAHDLGAYCIKLEAAEPMDGAPCLVIRGISDYADSHKNKAWQKYAAAVAAAYAKELLLVIPTRQIHQAPRTNIIVSDFDRPSTIVPPTDSGYASTACNKLPYREEYRTESVYDAQSILSGREGLLSPGAAASQSNIEDTYDDDAESVYTAGPGIPPLNRQKYVSELVDDLFNNVQFEPYGHLFPERIHVVTRLLKAFAMRFGQFGSTQIHRDIMVFIRRYREEIASGLRTRYLEDDQTNSQAAAYDDTKMDLGDLMDLWHQNLDPDDDVGNPPDDNGSESSNVDDSVPIEIDEEELPGLATYKDLITSSPMYEWLLGSIRRELNLHRTEPNAKDAIRNRILSSLPLSRTVSRYDQPRIYQAKFTLNWDPMAFVKEQEYDTSKEGFLGNVITITGSSQDAQAMTCLQYLHQTWHSYEVDIIQLFEATLLNEHGYEHRCTLSDNAKLAAWVEDENFIVEVTGIEDSIAQIGEQLAWLGSALRSSPHGFKISYCTPFISSASIESTSSATLHAPNITKISCLIDFRFADEERSSPPSSSGQCWHHLFRNPTVVTGFPIPYRSRQGTGLEIPLNILAGLAQAKHVDFFDERLYIKGFSSLLIPTKYIRDQDQIVWHLLFNVNGERISYLDGIEAHAGHITLADLERSRHIIGWCSDARCYAGAAEANYSINRSWLRRPSSRCSLGNTFVSAGRLITGGDMTIYGSKDQPYRLIRDEYVEKLSWVAKQYVIFWDARERRGWLMNGACALLHLILASLHFNGSDPLGFAFRLNLTDMKGAKEVFTPSSAMEVLLNPDNLSLELYHAKEGEDVEARIPPVRIRDRVNRLYNILEKIMDHQAEIMGRHSEAPHGMARGNLEGWDFKDLATHEDPLYPRACKLRTRGKSWVDLTRAIRAPTLFGTGFGEILRPADTSPSCPYWSRLPRGKSYLAVSDGDLANIIDRFGNPNSNPVRLTHDLIWCNYADNAPRDCECIGHPEKRGHSELAQVILPSRFRKKIPRHSPVRLKNWGNGAVIFGYNGDLPWSWKDTGFPEQDEASSFSDDSGWDSDDAVRDSGIGTSLVPSTTVGSSRELPLSRSQPEGMTHEDYEVGIICALWEELLAVRALFDSDHPDLAKAGNDPNDYCLGRMKRFNVVAAGLPQDDHGTNSATNVASHLIRTFPRLKFCLVVGIGGGVPSAASDIRLGDVVVGTGVIQMGKRKRIQDSEFQMTADKQKPPSFLRAVITKIQSDCLVSFNSSLNPLLDDVNLIASRRPEYQYPGADRDMLFDTNQVHVQGASTCDNCTGTRWPRVRQHDGPNVFYGLIASGDELVRDAKHRDRSGKENVICFEMEAAGVMRTTTNCLVIRGISDYADSHKNDLWRQYASATAAAYAKFFLSHMPESVYDISVRVPSRLGALTEPIHLQKQKRAAPIADHDQPLVVKRYRRD
ncbi:purine and uridine phosphorylase [Aspergillus floccosus]